MHLQLWLLLHCHKHTSTPQTSSAAFSAEVAVGVERAAAVGVGGEQSSCSAPRRRPGLSVEAPGPSAAGSAARGDAERLQRPPVPGTGRSARQSPQLPAAQPKVSCERPPAAEVRRAQWPAEGWVGGPFRAPGDPLCRRSADVRCLANFQKLLQTHRRGDLHGGGPRSARLRPRGNAG